MTVTLHSDLKHFVVHCGRLLARLPTTPKGVSQSVTEAIKSAVREVNALDEEWRMHNDDAEYFSIDEEVLVTILCGNVAGVILLQETLTDESVSNIDPEKYIRKSEESSKEIEAVRQRWADFSEILREMTILNGIRLKLLMHL